MEISEMEQQVNEAEECNHSLRTRKTEVMKELEGLRAQVEASHKEVRHLVKEQEVNREQEGELMGKRYETPDAISGVFKRKQLFTHSSGYI